jgi:hypothetical protein
MESVTTMLTNSMADLAEQVREAQASGAAASTLAAEKAIQSGRLLLEAKGKCAHGEWAPFLERAGVHERQARRLMQLARSGLAADTVSELGGFKAALEWLSRWILPTADEVVFVARAGDRDQSDHIACIIPSEVAGHFDVTAIGPEGTYFTTKSPVPGESRVIGDSSVNVLFETVRHALPVPPDEWNLVAGPIYMLLDDCEFLTGMVTDSDRIPLPHSYQHMIETLEACAASFSMENYFRARRAQVLCVNQINTWPDDPRMMRTLAHIANNDKVQKLAAKVDAMAKDAVPS